MKRQMLLLLIILAISSVFGQITLPQTGSNDDVNLQPSPKISVSGTSLQQQMAKIHNSYGKYLSNTASARGYLTADCAAVLKVESSGNGFAANGKMIIRFENHVFYKYYTNSGSNAGRVATFNQYFQYNSGQTWTGHMWRKSTSDSWISFHGNQDLEWQVLQFAQNLDDTAALNSASYGAPQIMGFNYQTIGYTSVQQMFISFSGSISKQLDGLFAFIKNNKNCNNALLARPADYRSFASCYNGAGQADAYGNLIKDAAVAYNQVVSGGSQTQTISVGNTVQFLTTVNLRSTASTSGSILGSASNGQTGTVVGGPATANGYQWYQIQVGTITAWAAYQPSWYQRV